MRYQDLNGLLLSRFPELEPQYRTVRAMYPPDEEPGPHVVYGDVLTPHVISLLETGVPDQQVSPFFDFLEQLAGSTDQQIRDVVGATVCERLNHERVIRSRARRFMGPVTQRLAEAVEETWG